ncbi:MAG: peptide chain release factor N(5)-glutamine methyltransferase [Desulfobulbaceae bacterium]|uniref:Release factor glutamine methyltransferase n=1 Tax=Candidatus Desulfatifera sulfidica TaxID=2841691 RepID=A0A8J6NB41_9BACT|nr:peptide chain release factor N(5)-glutamine methyltransferase [Candidatus Desulfatifera sulfidica]
MQVAELILASVARLRAAGIEAPEVEVNILLGHCLGKSRTQLLLASQESVVPELEHRFLALLERRLKREPSAYLLGEREFWSLPFRVTPDVLIPRPETEFLLEQVLTRWPKKDGFVLDLCCGSGVIAVVLAKELGVQVLAVDFSAAALVIAQENARRHGVDRQIHFVRGDLLTCLGQRNRFSLVVSNPPYVSRPSIENELEAEVVEYEPHLALDGGPEGLDLIHRIACDLPSVLAPDGHFFMEFGSDQGRAIQALFSSGQRWKGRDGQLEILQDYAGHDRVLHVTGLQ